MSNHKVIDRLAASANSGETGRPQGLPAENVESTLGLIQPVGVHRSKLTMAVGIRRQPLVMFGLRVLKLSTSTWMLGPSS